MTTRRIASLLAAFALTAASTGRGGQQPQASRGALPRVVVAVEGLAEDIQADLDTLGWTVARAKLAQLQASRSTLRTAVLADRAPPAGSKASKPPGTGKSNAAKVASYDAALDALATQIGRRDRLASLESANRMSRVLLAVAADYDLTVPVQVGLLDVAGRDAIYRAEAGLWQEASASVAELRAQYAAVQAHIVMKDAALNGRLAQRLTALDAAVSAKSATRVRTVATGLLGDVDLVERTY
jgi:hypothetical protein